MFSFRRVINIFKRHLVNRVAVALFFLFSYFFFLNALSGVHPRQERDVRREKREEEEERTDEEGGGSG